MSLAQIRDAVNRLEKAFEDRGHTHETTHELLHKVLKEMSILSDAVAANTAAVADNTAATNAAVALITAGGPSDAADVAAAVAALTTNTAQTVTNTDALNNAKPPAP